MLLFSRLGRKALLSGQVQQSHIPTAFLSTASPPAIGYMNIALLQEKKLSELQQIAKDVGVSEYSDLRKKDLIYRIIETRAEQLPGSVAEPAVAYEISRKSEKNGRSNIAGPDDRPAYMRNFDPKKVRLPGLIKKEGVLEVLPDGYGFLRSVEYHYLSSPDDIYVSPSQIKRFSLLNGDTIAGEIRPPREGQRFFALIKVESINGCSPEKHAQRVGFDFLTPSYPDTQIVLETDPDEHLGRIIDLFAPIGKGQRGLVLSPPGSDPLRVVKRMAESALQNDPELQVLILLVSETAEESARMAGASSAEVVTSMFDAPADQHIQTTNLVFDKARRAVEAGQDVLLFVSSLAALVRALSVTGDLDEGLSTPEPSHTAIRELKKYFASARAMEEGGSMTIVAVAQTEDTFNHVVLEEFRSTCNLELVLLPGDNTGSAVLQIDVLASGAKYGAMLYSDDTWNGIQQVRQSLSGLPPKDSAQRVHEMLSAAQTNEALLS